MGKIRKKITSRGATLPEYALVFAIMAVVAYGGFQLFWDPLKDESAKQQACISQNPPPPPSEDGTGCELPVVSTTAPAPTIPQPPPPSSVPLPEQLSAPSELLITPGYDASGNPYFDLEFNPPVNSTAIPIGKYQYTTNFSTNDGNATWRDRGDGAQGTTMRVQFKSETFNEPFELADFYNIAVRAVDQDGRPGKRSEVFRVGTPRAKMECGSTQDFCPENFLVQRPADSSSPLLKGVHKLEGGTESLVFSSLFFAANTSIESLVVGGGGGGGSNGGGGGGGGAVLYSQNSLAVPQPTNSSNFYLLIAGNGGAAGFEENRGGQGGVSLFSGLIAQGGGGGTSRDGEAASPPCNNPPFARCPSLTFSSRAPWDSPPNGLWSSLVVNSIASAGGGANTTTGYRRAGGNGQPGKGNNGGWGCVNSGANCGDEGGGGGGGGAGGAGGAGLFTGTVRGGAGGAGITNQIEGSARPYGAGGGGGKTRNGTAGLGGGCLSSDFDGCAGGSSRSDRRTDGQDGRGSGGAGGSATAKGATNTPLEGPGRGGGGVVIIRYDILYLKLAEAES